MNQIGSSLFSFSLQLAIVIKYYSVFFITLGNCHCGYVLSFQSVVVTGSCWFFFSAVGCRDWLLLILLQRRRLSWLASAYSSSVQRAACKVGWGGVGGAVGVWLGEGWGGAPSAWSQTRTKTSVFTTEPQANRWEAMDRNAMSQRTASL